jgi:hypothetical protein
MRNILIIPLVFGLGAAQAADTTLTLACQGTVTTKSRVPDRIRA